MSKKTELVASYLAKIKPAWPVPEPLPEASLLEQGMYAVIRRRASADKARSALKHLGAAYADWNELRVAQVQEIAGHLKLGKSGVRSAGDLKTYLQEVFQNSHGLDLEFLRDDPVASSRFVVELTFLGFATANYLLWLAGDRVLPVSTELVRVLDRLDVIKRTASMRKARIAIEPIVPKGDVLTFATRFGEVASNWCHKKPLCHLCPLVDDCQFGAKTFKEWEVQQARLAAQREKEAARREVQREKDEARRLREQERERKRAEAAAKKKSREFERRRRVERKKKRVLEQKRAREDAVRKRAEVKVTAAKKKAAAAKKDALKRAAAKKDAAKKAAVVKKAAAKKAAAKKTAAKKAAGKKTAVKKKSKKKAAPKPAAKKRPPERAKPSRKPVRKKAAKKKPLRKPAASKSKKKPTRAKKKKSRR